MSAIELPSLIKNRLGSPVMKSSIPSRWLHRFAWLTALLTLLLPVTTGAIVTTLKAGMAFGDWPSSDGYTMVTYPWLTAARDQFVEHSHRLAGLTIGVLSVGLAAYTWCSSSGRLSKYLAAAIFGSVVVQGLLGGARVLLDRETMALVHGDFAAGVFSLMAVLVLTTAVGWEARVRLQSRSAAKTALTWALIASVLMSLQYFFGGVLRHLKLAWAWNLHPWFALAPLAAALMFALVVKNSESLMLKRCVKSVVVFVSLQMLLGLATWFVRYGVPSWGVVAEQESIPMVVICSLHKILGMLCLMTTVVSVVCVASIFPKRDIEHQPVSVDFEASVMGVAT